MSNNRVLACGCLAAILLVSLSSARADEYWVVPAGQSNDWSVPGNWNAGAVPTSSDTARIANGGTATVSASGEVCGTLSLGGTGSGTVQMTSGSLTVAGSSNIGYSGTGTFTQSGGTNTAGSMCLGYSAGSAGTYNLNGGLLNLTALSGGSGSAAFNFSGGTLQAGGPLSTSVPIALGGGNATFDTASTTITLSGQISGAGSLVKVSSGALTLSGANNYSGGTTIAQGNVVLQNNSGLGTGAISLSGGTLQLAGPALPIGVKFAVGAGSATAGVTGPAGVAPMSNWNNLSGASQSSPQPLIDSSGKTTTAAATWNASSPYSTYGTNETDQNAQLLNAYLGGYGATVTISGIPFSSYSVYAYFTNNYANHAGRVAIGGTTYYYHTLGPITTTPYPLVQTTDTTYDSTGASYPLTNYALFNGLSGATQTVTLTTQGTGDSGIAAVEIVGPGSRTGSFSAATNAVGLTANSTIDVSGISGGTLGNFTAAGNNTLFVTGASTAGNIPYSLTLGTASLGGNPTFDVANNGTGTGTLVLGALADGGTARTVTKADAGALILATAATSLVQGTRVNVNGGMLNSNNAAALGAFAQVNLAGGATFSLGASQQISSLSGLGSVALGGNTLTVGSSDNLSSAFSGAIGGAGGIAKRSSGTLTLNGTSSYSGGTTISQGIVAAGTNNALGSGPVTLAGGTLRLAIAGPIYPIGVKLGCGGFGETGTVTGTAGVVPMSNWNNLSGQSQPSPQPLVNSLGGSSGAAVTWASTWSNWATFNGNQTDQNAQLLNTYLTNTGSSQTVTISGISFSSYAVYAYFTNNYANNFGSVAIGGTTYYYQTLGPITTRPYPLIQTTDTTFDSTGASYPLTNYAQFIGLTGSTQTITLTPQSVGDSGLAALEIVGPAGQAVPICAANAVQLTANSTIDVSGSTGGTLGNFTATGNNTLFVTGSSTAANAPYSLTLGTASLGGSPTFDVAKNGTGTGTLFLGALADGGTACTITKTDAGILTLATAAASLVQGTRINVSGGTLNSNNAASLGALAQVTVAGGRDFNLGASQQISSLGGLGSVTLGGYTLTIGNSDNLSGTFSGTISGGWVQKAGAGTLTLSGVNTYFGPTFVNAGNLVVIGSLGNTAVRVGGGATLGGTGSIAGSVVVTGGSTAGTQGAISLVDGAIGALTLNDPNTTDTVLTVGGAAGNPSALDFEVGAGGADCILVTTGIFTVEPGGATIVVVPLAGIHAGTYHLIDFPSGEFSSLGSFSLSTTALPGYTLALQQTSTSEELVVAATPEPSTLALLAAGAIGLLAYGWRRRRAA